MTVPHRCYKLQLTQIGLVGITAGLTGLAVWNYVSIVTSPAAKIVETYPTSIPWLQDQTTCEKTDRSWYNEQCWDVQHDSNF